MSYSISSIHQFKLSFWIFNLTDLTGEAILFFLYFKGKKLFSNNAEVLYHIKGEIRLSEAIYHKIHHKILRLLQKQRTRYVLKF